VLAICVVSAGGARSRVDQRQDFGKHLSRQARFHHLLRTRSAIYHCQPAQGGYPCRMITRNRGNVGL
jgi:hypothetical protein